MLDPLSVYDYYMSGKTAVTGRTLTTSWQHCHNKPPELGHWSRVRQSLAQAATPRVSPRSRDAAVFCNVAVPL